MKSILDGVTYCYLFLESIVFKDGELFINLDQAALSTEKEDVEIVEGHAIKGCRSVEVMDETLGFQIHFSDPVYYQVIGESANDFSGDTISEQGNIITFSESSLIKYLRESTDLFDFTAQSEELVHYCVTTADEWIHVLSRVEPVVSQKCA